MVRIVKAQPLSGYRLNVVFDDGLEGVYSVEPERRGGVFLRLLDAKIFNAVEVNPLDVWNGRAALTFVRRRCMGK